MSDRAAWWREARFGMFIHWGLYSIPGRGEWVMWWEETPAAEYRRLARRFTARACDPEEWVRTAEEAGAKYVILTARHHDGFCLWDSRVSDFSTAKTACGRDIVAEYVAACRRRGMRIGIYYSLLDWRFDAYRNGPAGDPSGWRDFVGYVHAQVEELMTGYGPVDLLWYDGGWPWTAADWEAERLNAMVRRHQPAILINDRSGTPEDFNTQAEQTIRVADRDWECTMPLYDFWWSDIPGDRRHKDAWTVVRNLSICAGHGGNYLLDIGPKPDGSVAAADRRTMAEVGAWLRRNGESVYGTSAGVSNVSPTPLVTPYGSSTRAPGRVYLHMFYRHREFVVPGVEGRVVSARFLADGTPVPFSQEGSRVKIGRLPARLPDPLATVIALTVEETT